MASSSKTRLSTSTLSLRFMQRAPEDAVLPQQAKLTDDSEWHVGQDVLDMWASQRRPAQDSEEALHESSYLPFVFGETSQSLQSSSSTGKRTFGTVKPDSPKKEEADMEEDKSTENKDEDTKQEQDEDEDMEPKEQSPRLNLNTKPVPPRTFPNNRQPRVSKAVRVVQLAYEAQAKEAEHKKTPKYPNPVRDPAIASYQHRDVTRRLYKPGVHMPEPEQEEEESTSKKESDKSVGEQTKSPSATGHKRKRKPMTKVDVMNDRALQKKLKEIK